MPKIISLLILAAGGAAAFVWLRSGAAEKVGDAFSNANGDGKAYAFAEKAIDKVSEPADRTGDRSEQVRE